MSKIERFIKWYIDEIERYVKTVIENFLISLKEQQGGPTGSAAQLLSVEDIYNEYRDFCIGRAGSLDNLSSIKFTPAIISSIESNNKTLATKLGNIPTPYYRLFALVDLYDRVSKAKLPSLLLEEVTKDKYDTQYDNELHQDINLNIYKCRPPLVPARNFHIIRCIIAQYTQHDLKERAPQIAKYFKVEVSGDDINACSIKIERRDYALKNEELAKSTLVTDLEKDLGDNVTTFSYAVTPRNMMQRLGIIGGDNNALSILGEVKINETLAAQAINLLQQRSEKLELAQAFPIIVGFGSNIPSSSSRENEIQVRFGWVIAPAVHAGIDSLSSRQISQQYTLAAVVSLPSWWRQVKIIYTVCWVDPSLRLTMHDFSACSTISKRPPSTIRLPGKVDEISRKLDFWVINEPNLVENQRWDLVVGRKQSLVIQGTRLWRSTAVTLWFAKGG